MRTWFAAMGLLVGAAGALLLAPPAAADDDCADGYLVRCQQNGRTVTNPGVSRPAGQVPTVQGVPCTGEHLGVCIALSQANGGGFPGLTTGPVLGPGAIIRNSP